MNVIKPNIDGRRKTYFENSDTNRRVKFDKLMREYHVLREVFEKTREDIYAVVDGKKKMSEYSFAILYADHMKTRVAYDAVKKQIYYIVDNYPVTDDGKKFVEKKEE